MDGSIADRFVEVWRLFQALPIVTQWAVTILFVSCLMIHLLVYNERTVHDGPSIFTTGGIFFTFLGIAEGLYGFDPQKLDASVPLLLDGLKTAFIASVVGVGAALSIKLRFALFGLRERKSNSTVEGGATIDDLFGQMAAVQQSIAGKDESTLISQIKLTRQDANDRLDSLRRSQDQFLEKLANNNSKALIEALQEVIRDFNAKISEQFGDNFKQLNEAVDRLLTWQVNYQSQLSELIRQQTQTAEDMRGSAESFTNLVGKAQTFASIATELSGVLTGLETQRKTLHDSLSSLGKLLTAASEGLPQIEKKIMQLTEQMTYGVRTNQEEMTKAVRDNAVALQGAVADVKTILMETIQSSNRQVNDHMKQLSDKTTENFQKLDVALETELSKAISSLGRQLTALSSRFVEDYGPLTEKLRLLVQTSKGA